MKRLCLSCGAHFYDLGKNPAECPKCGTKIKVDAVARYRRAPAKPADPPPKPEAPKAAEGGEEMPKNTADVAGDDLAEDLTDNVDDATDDVPPADPNEDDDLIEDASDLGRDADDMSEVLEHVDEDVTDKS